MGKLILKFIPIWGIPSELHSDKFILLNILFKTFVRFGQLYSISIMLITPSPLV